MKRTELGCSLGAVFSFVAVIIAPFAARHRWESGSNPGGDRVITLTGVASAGVWTEQEVTAWNYPGRRFAPAALLVSQGETILLKLKSADVVHSFYCPALGIGPLDVYPGKIVSTKFTALQPGVFEYFCLAMCGECHFHMKGTISVGEVATPAVPDFEAATPHCAAISPLPPEPLGFVEKGKDLFHRTGCSSCHGREARGNVPNYNYVKKVVPALTTMAEKMLLQDEEEVDIMKDLLENRADLDTMDYAEGISQFLRVKAQYNAVLDVILNGREAAPLDSQKALPPLRMPSWYGKLNAGEIDAIIAYLLSLQNWEKEIL